MNVFCKIMVDFKSKFDERTADQNISREMGQVRLQFTLEQATKANGESIDLLFLQPRRLVGVGVQSHALAACSPGKTLYPLYRRLGGPQSWSGRVRKTSHPTAREM
jgi:hypothetical protein